MQSANSYDHSSILISYSKYDKNCLFHIAVMEAHPTHFKKKPKLFFQKSTVDSSTSSSSKVSYIINVRSTNKANMRDLAGLVNLFGQHDLEIWWMTLKNNRASLLCSWKLCASFHSHLCIETKVLLVLLWKCHNDTMTGTLSNRSDRQTDKDFHRASWSQLKCKYTLCSFKTIQYVEGWLI